MSGYFSDLDSLIEFLQTQSRNFDLINQDRKERGEKPLHKAVFVQHFRNKPASFIEHHEVRYGETQANLILNTTLSNWNKR